MTPSGGTLDDLCINTIRTLSIDTVEKAASGHPGMPMGAATMAYVLWTRHLSYDPADPEWIDRDRFVLSAGHGSMLLYSLLLPDGVRAHARRPRALPALGQPDARSPRAGSHDRRRGHHRAARSGVRECRRDGDRGAVARRHVQSAGPRDRGPPDLRHRERRRPDGGHRLGGGVARRRPPPRPADRPLRLEPHHALRDAPTSPSPKTSARASRHTAGTCSTWTGWTWPRSTRRSRRARADERRPSLIVARTHIGFGSPHKQDTFEAHGEPLGEDEVRLTKRAYGWPEDAHVLRAGGGAAGIRQGSACAAPRCSSAWRQAMDGYRAAHGELAGALDRAMAGELPPGWDAKLPVFTPEDGDMATRDAGGKVIAALAESVPNAGRRVGRPRSVDAHHDEREGGLSERRGAGGRADAADAGIGRRGVGVRGTEHPFRHPRARDDRDPHGDGASRRRGAVRRDLPHVLRLHAPEHPAGRAERGARHLRVDPRQHRARRGRPDPPAGRAARQPAGDAEHARCSGRPTPTRPSRRGGSRCSTRPGPVGLVLTRQKLPVLDRTHARPGRRHGTRRLRADRRGRGGAGAHSDRDRLGGVARARGAPAARAARAFGAASCRCRRGSCSRRNPPNTARRCCRPRCARGSAWKPARRSAGNATWGRQARSSAWTASARRRRDPR